MKTIEDINKHKVKKNVSKKKNPGLFTGEGVERTFPLYGTLIDTIKVIRSGKVRRAKLYYLRDRTGKSARIAEKIRKKIGIEVDVKPETVTEENVAPATVEEESKTETLQAETKKESPEEKK